MFSELLFDDIRALTKLESSETVSSIRPESQPANAVPSMLESVCESVETLLIRSMYKLCLGNFFFPG